MDLAGSLKLIFWVCRTFGIAPYKFRKHKQLQHMLLESSKDIFYTKVMTFVYVLTVVTVFLTLPGHFAVLFQVPSTTVKTLFLIIFSTNAFSVYVTVIRQRKLICECNNLINETCSGKACKELSGFNRKIVFWYWFLHCLCNGVSSFSQISIFTQLRLAPMFEWIFLSIWSLAEDFFICQIICFMNLADFKFERIHRRLTDEFKFVDGAKELKWLRAEDMLVKDYVEILSGVFQYCLLLHISQLFMSALSLTFEMMVEEVQKIHIFGFLGYLISRLIPILAVFEGTRKKAEKTANYVHELFLDNDDPQIREEIEIFSLQLQHRKVEFNACGFFKLDFTLLYSMIGAVTTYIIILMQFQKEDPTSVERRTKRIANCSLLFYHYTVSDVYRCLNSTSGQT